MKTAFRRNNQMAEESLVYVLYTGGTIGMMENSEGVLAPADDTLSSKVRLFCEMHDPNYVPKIEYTTDSFLVLPARKNERRIIYKVKDCIPLLDSSNMTLEDWAKIAREIEANYYLYDGFVILHGTDTLAYTASALSFMLQNLRKSVVITGSMVPIFDSPSDGPYNFTMSLVMAGIYKIPEVTVFFGNKLLRGNRTIKFSSDRNQAFDSPNIPPLALCDVNIQVNENVVLNSKSRDEFWIHTNLNKNVAILYIYPTLTGAMIDSLLLPPIEGVILLSYGCGNIPSNRIDVISAIASATARGVIVVNCTQCPQGGVDDVYSTGHILNDAGVISGGDMTVEAAFTKLCYILSKRNCDANLKKEMMMSNLRGELTT